MACGARSRQEYRSSYVDAGLEALLEASGVLELGQYMDNWRLDRRGVRPVANTEVKKALGFN